MYESKIQWPTLAICACLAACGDREPPADSTQVYRALNAEVVGERLEALAQGESCAQGGKRSCAAGACLHMSSDPRQRHFCSNTCVTENECPENWSCAQIPGVAKHYCIPPKNWEAQRAQTRTTFQPTRALPPLSYAFPLDRQFTDAGWWPHGRLTSTLSPSSR